MSFTNNVLEGSRLDFGVFGEGSGRVWGKFQRATASALKQQQLHQQVSDSGELSSTDSTRCVLGATERFTAKLNDSDLPASSEILLGCAVANTDFTYIA